MVRSAVRARPAPGLTVRVVGSAADVPEGVWSELASPDDPLWGRDVFLAMERSGIGPAAWHYVIVERDERVVAVLPVQEFRRLDLADVLDAPGKRVLAAVRRGLPGVLHVDALFAGNLLGSGTPLVAAGEDRRDVVRRCGLELRRLADRRRAPWVVWKDLPDVVLDECRDVLGDLSFFAVPAAPDAVVRLEAGSVDDLVSALPAKPRRNWRAKRRRFDRTPGMTIGVEADVSAIAADLQVLYTHVLDRAETRLERLTEAFWREIARPGAGAHVVVARRDGAPVGFQVWLLRGRTAVALRVGLDYDVAGDAAVYHNLHYAGIELALAAGCTRVELLQTAYEAKRELGCVLEPLSHAVTHRNPIMRGLLARALPRLVSPPPLPSPSSHHRPEVAPPEVRPRAGGANSAGRRRRRAAVGVGLRRTGHPDV